MPPGGVCVYFSYGIPETVGWVHHGESFYIGEIKITGGAMPCPACSQVNSTDQLQVRQLHMDE